MGRPANRRSGAGKGWHQVNDDIDAEAEIREMQALADQQRSLVTLPSELAVTPDTTNPLAMLHLALERGTDPNKLEKLMDLAERYKADRAAEEFNCAMNSAQQFMPVVVRDAANPHTNSRYARLENVQSVIRPVYTREGFSLTFGEEESKLEGCRRIICDVAHRGGCVRRYHLDCPLDGAGIKGGQNKTGIQGLGSTISYARRYLTLMIFNVTIANEDLDGNAQAELESITRADVVEIESLIDEKKVDVRRFLEWAEVTKISDIKARDLAKVLDTLSRKKAPGAP